jgi:acetyltransferase-like isoleucine patch superfamily enzyme
MANQATVPKPGQASVPHPAPEAEEVYRRWIQFLDDEFTRHHHPERRSEIVRDQLYQLYLGRPHGGKLNLTLTSELPGNVLSLSLDPENVTLEAGHFGDVDRQKFNERKPLLWFWQMFDHSPVGRNVRLGTQMRYMLAQRVFKKCGKSVRIFHEVEFSFGYNLTVGDGVTIHRNVLIDDRAEVLIGEDASISDYANIYSHSHAVEDIHDVGLHRTEVGARARITYHSVILAGVRVANDAIVGSMGVASKPVEAGWIVGGVPAKQIGTKSVKP